MASRNHIHWDLTKMRPQKPQNDFISALVGAVVLRPRFRGDGQTICDSVVLAGCGTDSVLLQPMVTEQEKAKD